MGQTNNGSTDNANISMGPNGAYSFYFDDPFDMLINMTSATSIISDGSNNDDKFNLQNSSGNIINGNGANDIFNIAGNQSSLNGNIINGQTGYNFVTISGSVSGYGNAGTDVNLAGSTGVTGVIANLNSSGNSVEVALNQFSSSALKGVGGNRGFATVLGAGGAVNLTVSSSVKFVGVLTASGLGFDASGAALSTSALATLKGAVTSDAGITGNLAALYGGSYNMMPSNQVAVNDLNAYVFQSGANYYTLWSDGQVTEINAVSAATTALYNPGQTAPATAPVYQSVSMFNKAGSYGGANIYTDINGNADVRLFHGGSQGSSAINLTNGVSGVTVHGDTGPTGVPYFGLGQSGGNNHVISSISGSTFDLGLSTALKDILTGGKGFDVVQAHVAGTDIDLTAGNGTTGTKSTFIDAVVGNASATGLTVELDVTTLTTTNPTHTVPSAVFEAMIGSTGTLNLTTTATAGSWIEVGKFAPGSAPLPHASGLIGAAELDSLYVGGKYTAESQLTGYLLEKVNAKGAALEYLTIYTDGTLHAASPDFHF